MLLMRSAIRSADQFRRGHSQEGHEREQVRVPLNPHQHIPSIHRVRSIASSDVRIGALSRNMAAVPEGEPDRLVQLGGHDPAFLSLPSRLSPAPRHLATGRCTASARLGATRHEVLRERRALLGAALGAFGAATQSHAHAPIACYWLTTTGTPDGRTPGVRITRRPFSSTVTSRSITRAPGRSGRPR
jgi:hypothetical protein